MTFDYNTFFPLGNDSSSCMPLFNEIANGNCIVVLLMLNDIFPISQILHLMFKKYIMVALDF